MAHGAGLSKGFLRRLAQLDPALRATLDQEQDAIVLWSQRVGQPSVHEYTSFRKILEKHSFLEGVAVEKKLSTPDLEAFTLQKLREIDVWQRHGSGKTFDNYLHDTEETYREKERKKYQHARREMWKQNRSQVKEAIWNAQHGRFDSTTAIKMPDRTGTGWTPDLKKKG